MSNSRFERRSEHESKKHSRRDTSRTAEQADVVAGCARVGTGVVALARFGPTKVEFSVVNGRAIFEGDIELGRPGELAANARALAAAAGEMQAAVVADTSKRWPKATVPYERLPESSPIQAIVNGAMDAIMQATPVRFVPREAAAADYLAFEVSAFCSSQVGRAGGRQVVRLTATAVVGNAIHELCHTLGLWHEQSRKDRDSYIRIRWENIIAGYEHNFRQEISDEDDVGAYDFGSIMHYPPDAFSSNGQPTLEAISGHPAFGQRDGLSELDIAAIQRLYGANAPVPQPKVVPDVGNGVQFRVTVDPHSEARVVTTGWPTDEFVDWNVICVDGPIGAGPVLTWDYAVGRSSSGGLDYYFTISNLVDEPVTAEARYVVR